MKKGLRGEEWVGLKGFFVKSRHCSRVVDPTMSEVLRVLGFGVGSAGAWGNLEPRRDLLNL